MTIEMIGIGSPLVDYLLQVEESFLNDHVEGAKGGMEMVDADQIIALIEKCDNPAEKAAGGAASNTTLGCANLGIASAFIGSCGKDDLAAFFKKTLELQGCEPRLIEHSDQPTGHVLSLVTPDAERTMRTCLGAAAALDPGLVTADMFAGARLVMLEGYTLFNHDLTRAIAASAKEAGCELAVDLASFEVVNFNREVLTEIIDQHVDLVFANEDEAAAWHADGVEAALHDLADRCSVAVVKEGADGAWIMRGEEKVRVAAERVENVIDTTGAGDNWAAGFLAGYLRGLPLEHCGQLGSMAGASVVQVTGAQPKPADWSRIKGYLDAWGS